MLSSLPKYRLLDITVTWIGLEEVARLDTALCSTKSRCTFLDYISGITFHGVQPKIDRSTNSNTSFMESNSINCMIDWLSFRNLKVGHVLLTNDTFGHALEVGKLESLTSLSLSLSSLANCHTTAVPSEMISSFLANNQTLTSFNVSQGGLVITEQSLIMIIKHYRMKLSTLVLGFNSNLSTKLVVFSIVEFLSNSLTSLHMSASRDIDDSDIELICLNCCHLISLDISRNDRLTARRSGISIVNNLTMLRSISFDQKSPHTNAEFFVTLRRRFLQLKFLDLIRHSVIGVPVPDRLNLTKDDIVNEVTTSLKPLGFCFCTSDILNLNEKTYFMPSCLDVELVVMPKFVFGYVLDTFIWHCSSHIKMLDLQGYAQGSHSPLDPQNDISDSSLFVLAARCTSLESVNFSHRECITDEGMMALVKANPGLLSVRCAHCTNLCSGTIYSLAENCRKLEVLNFSGCRDIFDDCLIQLSSSCPRLVHLGFKNLDSNSVLKVTQLSMDSFVLNCKGLQNIHRTSPALSYSVKLGFYNKTFGIGDHIPQLEAY